MSDVWRETIDDALVVNGLPPTSDNESPVAALHRLIAWEVQVALDPQVSHDARMLRRTAALKWLHKARQHKSWSMVNEFITDLLKGVVEA